MLRGPNRFIYPLAVLGSITGLSGCLEDIEVTRFSAPPTAIATGLQFADKNTGPLVGGTIKISPANDGQTNVDAWTFDSYILRWGYDGQPTPNTYGGISNYIGRVDRMSQPLQLNISTTPPQGANSIIVYTENALGAASEGYYINFENVLVDPLVPSINARPEVRTFSDSNSSVRMTGALRFSKPYAYNKCTDGVCQYITDTEADIEWYNVRFADNNGCPLPGPEVARVPKIVGGTGSYYAPIGYDKVVVPTEAMKTMAVIPANSHGEAYSETCQYAHSPGGINFIRPSEFPHYVATVVTLSPDTDSTDGLSATLNIEKTLDERDLSTGYYVHWDYTSGGGLFKQLAHFWPDGSNHSFQFNNWVPKDDAGNVLDITHISLYVSTGQPNRSGNHVREIKLGNDNRLSTGNWYLINLGNEVQGDTTMNCIKADTYDGDIKKATCDKYDEAQRFTVDSANVAGNDDMFFVRSMKHPGQCIYRADDAGAPNWRLHNCEDTWNMRIEIKATDTTAAKRMYKKMALNSGASWTCLAHYTVTNDLSSPWGNCGIVTGQIYQRFLKVGRTNDFGYFND